MQSQFAFANQVAAARDQVAEWNCDAEGYVIPDTAESRFQAAFAQDCHSPFDPYEAVRAFPRKPARFPEPPQEVLDASLGSLWVRERKMCRDPHGWNVDKKIGSEKYPLPASEVRDSRPPLLQVGSQSRFDGRDPVPMYRKLRGDQF